MADIQATNVQASPVTYTVTLSNGTTETIPSTHRAVSTIVQLQQAQQQLTMMNTRVTQLQTQIAELQTKLATLLP